MPSPRTPSRTALLMRSLCVVSAFVAGTSNAHATNAVSLFDTAVSRALPQTVMFSSSTGTLVVESTLDVEIRFPGSVSANALGSMYRGTWNGEQAVVTRSGDHLDISVPRGDTMDVIGFSRDTEGSHRIDGATANVAASKPAAQGIPVPRARRAAGLASLVFWIFLHDDTLDVSRQHIHASYVAWWIADMKRILPARRLWVIYSQQVEGMTDMPYGHPSTLKDWSQAVDAYAKREQLPRNRIDLDYKFMLLTKNDVVPGVSGLAWLGGHEAVATLKGRYSVVAHEFGHTLEAVHDHAEVRWSSGWPCETNLTSSTSVLRANCYRYSAANERRMRAYAAKEWTVPVRLHPPGIPRYIID